MKRTNLCLSGRKGLLGAALVMAVMASSPASAQTLTTLVNFDMNNGPAFSDPSWGLAADSSGNLFGAASGSGLGLNRDLQIFNLLLELLERNTRNFAI